MKIKNYLELVKCITNLEIMVYEMSKDNYRLKNELNEEIETLIKIRDILEEE